MFIIKSIIALIAIISIHELGHAYAMICKGVKIKKMGLGLPFGRYFSFRINKTIPRVIISPILLGAFVEPSFGGQKQIERLSYVDKSFINGAGIWANFLLALLILIPSRLLIMMRTKTLLEVIDSSFTDRVLIICVILFLSMLFFGKYFCAYIVPLLGVTTTILLVIFIIWNPTQFVTESGGPVTIIMDMAPRMTSFMDSCIEIALISLAVGLTQALPMGPLDGGKITRDILIYKFGDGILAKAYTIIGSIFLMIILILALFGDSKKLLRLFY